MTSALLITRNSLVLFGNETIPTAFGLELQIPTHWSEIFIIKPWFCKSSAKGPLSDLRRLWGPPCSDSGLKNPHFWPLRLKARSIRRAFVTNLFFHFPWKKITDSKRGLKKSRNLSSSIPRKNDSFESSQHTWSKIEK